MRYIITFPDEGETNGQRVSAHKTVTKEVSRPEALEFLQRIQKTNADHALFGMEQTALEGHTPVVTREWKFVLSVTPLVAVA